MLQSYRRPPKKPAKDRASTGQPSITTLYSEFEAAHAAFRAAEAELQPIDYNQNTPKNRQFEKLVNRCSKAAQRILSTPAVSTAEIILKIRALAWGHLDTNCGTLEEIDANMPKSIEETEAARVLASIQADLLLLAAH